MAAAPVSQFVFLIIVVGLTIFTLRYAKGRTKAFGTMRSITAMDHLEEAVGRAAEMGSSVFFTQGTGELYSSSAAAMLAGVAVMGRVGEYTAKIGVPLKVFAREGVLQNVCEQVLREAYTRVGKPEAFDPGMVVWTGNDFYAYGNACAQWILKEQPASTFMIGDFGGNALYISETGARTNALQIGGNYFIFAVTCDYFLIGEELYASAAYVSGDLEEEATVAAEDMSKVVAFALMLVGILAVLLGSKVITQALNARVY
jgi:hypothetical protein